MVMMGFSKEERAKEWQGSPFTVAEASVAMAGCVQEDKCSGCPHQGWSFPGSTVETRVAESKTTAKAVCELKAASRCESVSN